MHSYQIAIVLLTAPAGETSYANGLQILSGHSFEEYTAASQAFGGYTSPTTFRTMLRIAAGKFVC